MKKWLSRLIIAFILPCTLNLPLFLPLTIYCLDQSMLPGIVQLLLIWIVFLILSFTWLWLLCVPVRDRVKTGIRARMMMGGRRAVYWSLYGIVVQVLVFGWIYTGRLEGLPDFGLETRIVNAVLAVVGIFFLLASGVLRIFFTSRRLSLVRRLVMLLTMWIPIVNLAVLLYACRLVYEEYDFEREKAALRELRVESELCKTKYPLLMVHGIGFRDLRYFNYWGRESEYHCSFQRWSGCTLCCFKA